jgi:type II secretion system protein N
VTLTPRLKRILVIGGYVSFYFFALFTFFYLTFPYDRLKARIVQEFNARQTGPDAMSIELDELDSYWLSGVEAEGVRLISPGTPEAPGKPAKPKVTTIESAHARVGIFGLLFGSCNVTFGADAFGGTLEGEISDSEAERTVELEMDALDLSQTPVLAGIIGLPVAGALSGTANLVAPESRLSKAEGKVDLKLTGLAVGDGKAKIRDTIALPKLDAGELVLAAEITSGQLKVKQLSATGPDLELSAEGSIRLRDRLEQSLLSLTAQFKFTERYTNKDDLTRGLFGKSGLFDLDPKNRRAKRPDGFYGWRVSGSLGHPSFFPNSSTAGTVRKPTGAAVPTDTAAGP